MSARRALIAGVTGAIGSAVARELAGREDWSVIGLARRASPSPLAGVDYRRVDLGDFAASRDALAALEPVTHVFYCGRVTHAEQVIEDPAANLRLLDHLIRALEACGHPLAHVHLVQGGKVYGVHVGPFPTPAREDDPRPPIENFNFDQQDYLEAGAADGRWSWSWSASRPNTLLHFSPDIGRNLVSSVGSYAAIRRALGRPLDFPGVPGAWDSLTQLTTLALLARGIAWAATEPACANQAFNFTNTDAIRWGELWPRIADFFDMPCGEVLTMRLADAMPAHADVWAEIAARDGLRFDALDRVANWGYLDATFERYWDEVFSTDRAQGLGFGERDDSVARFLQLLGQYRDAGILP